MFERSTGGASAAVPRAGRAGAAALGASLLAHLFLLFGAMRSYHPAAPTPPGREPPRETVYFDLPPLPPTVDSRTPARPPEPAPAARAPGPPPRERATPLRAPEGRADAPPAPLDFPAEERPIQASSPRDPRLSVGVRATPAEREWMDGGISAAMRAAEDSAARFRRGVRIIGPGVAPFRDSTVWLPRRRRFIMTGDRPIMPTDGRAWVDRELNRQEADAAREAYLHERTRATRERADATRPVP